MRVLITGGAGFVGLALAEALSGAGHEAILFSPDRSPFQPLLDDSRVTFLPGDVRSREDLARAGEQGIEGIVHAAAITPAGKGQGVDADQVISTNVGGSIELARLARHLGCRRTMLLSSIAAYGEAQGRSSFSEDDPERLSPSLYGRSKREAEKAMAAILTEAGIPFMAARIGPVFGPWERAGKSRPVTSPHHQIMLAAERGETSVLARPLVADWFYSRDLARRLVLLMESDWPAGGLVNLGAGKLSSVADWCSQLANALPALRWSVDPANPSIVFNYERDRPPLDTSRLDMLLGRAAPRGLAEAVADHLHWRAQALPLDHSDTLS